jgi:hypothetical protein
MPRSLARSLVLGLGLSLIAGGMACGPTNITNPPGDGGSTTGHDRSVYDRPVVVVPDAPVVQEDAPAPVGDAYQPPDSCVAQTCPSPVNDGCLAAEICGNGLDDDCNGQVDEGCSCIPGAVQPCFKGPPGRRNVGACQDGTQRCEGTGEFGSWGDCTGGIWPTNEACDTVDNDCNGCVDDDPRCCQVDIQCPSPGSLPDADPYADYTLSGTAFYTGVATNWKWEVTGGPCDQLLWSTSHATSYTLNGQATTSVSSTTNSHLTFHPTLSGDYTVKVTVTTPTGDLSCTFIVHVKGPGFRVELCWDTTGNADIDLHVHKPNSTTDWFTTDGSSYNNDDCYYINCTATDYRPLTNTGANWSYTSTPLANCVGAPVSGGTSWATIGSCHNPRLDMDNISTPGKPENTNVDDPNNNDNFRVMVHYYGGSVATHPLVNIYCGGRLTATYGAAPDLVPGFNSGGSWGNGTMWRVTDVTTQVDSSGTTTGCDTTLLRAPGSTTGYYVTDNVRTY